MKFQNENIAIDGPAGSGKSTIAKEIAFKIGANYLDTGAMYRSVALYCLRNGIDVTNENMVKAHLDEINIAIEFEEGKQQVILNGENVNSFIRTPELGQASSKVSAIPDVRVKLVKVQQEFASRQKVVMDGRDIATFVLPDAFLKIFLTASAECRAMRRFLELQSKGSEDTYEQVLAEMKERDYRDTHREYAPLTLVEDAVLIDTTEMTPKEVSERILSLYENKLRESCN
ncbi:MAG: (d)CMP kinase [Lachnospiraceae bacterium]|nr:(d)CMP kinase [Lachnospiraceae bacterium]